MKTFGKGAKLFCDLHFGGKPKAVCLEVIKPGNGQNEIGTVRVKLTETVGAYRKGETLALSTYLAVPRVMERKPKRGEIFRRVSTLYRWEKDNFTPEQLAFARSHNWFISGNLSEIVCRNEWIKDGTRHEETVKHTNFRKLRDWAGY